MTESQPFVDYYAILQVAPRADRRTIRTAYRDMAKLYLWTGVQKGPR